MLLSSLPQNSPLDYFFAFSEHATFGCSLLIQIPFLFSQQKRPSKNGLILLAEKMGDSPVRGNVALRQKGCRPTLVDCACAYFLPILLRFTTKDFVQTPFSFSNHEKRTLKCVLFSWRRKWDLNPKKQEETNLK